MFSVRRRDVDIQLALQLGSMRGHRQEHAASMRADEGHRRAIVSRDLETLVIDQTNRRFAATKVHEASPLVAHGPDNLYGAFHSHFTQKKSTSSFSKLVKVAPFDPSLSSLSSSLDDNFETLPQ